MNRLPKITSVIFVVLLALVASFGFAAMEGADFIKAVQYTEQSFEALTNDRYVDAEKYANEALKAKPDYPEAMINLGVACYYQGRKDEAKNLFEKVAAMNSSQMVQETTMSGLSKMTVSELAKRNLDAIEGKKPALGSRPVPVK